MTVLETADFHMNLAAYFASKPLYLDEPTQLKSDMRKLVEQPWQLLQTQEWEKIEDLLTNLFFLEAKSEADLVFQLATDFKKAVAVVPKYRFKQHFLRLISESLDRDIHFISNHPTTIFQCLWNRCWWYDHPAAVNFFEIVSDSTSTAPWDLPEPRLYNLLEKWHEDKKQKLIDFTWVRALRPVDVLSDNSNQKVLRNHAGAVWSISISPDGMSIVSGGFDGTVRLWSVETGCELNHQHLHNKPVTMVQYSPDGQVICSSSRDGSMRFWGADSLDELSLIRIENKEIWAIAFMPDSKRIACGTDKGEIYIYLIKSHTLDSTFNEAHSDYENHVNTLLVSADGKKLIAGIGSANTERTEASLSGIWYWELSNSPCVGNRIGRNEEGNYCVTAISPNSENLAIGNQNMKVGNLGIEPSLLPISENNDWIRAIAYSSDGILIAFSGDNPTIHIWDTQTKSVRYNLEGHTERVECLSFFPDSHRIVSSSDDASIRIWNIDFQTTNVKIKTPIINPKEFAFSPNDTIGAFLQGNLVIVTDASFSICQRTLEHNSKVSCFCWTTDGTQIVSATQDGQIHFWNPWTYNQLKTISSKQNICCLASSDKGNWTISGNTDGKVHKWDSKGQSQELVLHNNPPPMAISCVTISSNGYLAAGATYDAVINVWHGHTGEILRRHIPEQSALFGFLAWGESHIHVLAFSENNNDLIILQTNLGGSVSQLQWNLEIDNNKPKVISSIVGDVKALAQGSDKNQWLALGRSPDTVIIDTKDKNKRVAFFPTQLSYLTSAPYCGLWANLKGTQFSVFHLERHIHNPKTITKISSLNNTPETEKELKIVNPEKMKNNNFPISFCLLLENESVLKYQKTIDSIEDFINSSSVVSPTKSEIICVTGVDEAASNIISKKLHMVGPREWTNTEKGTRIAPEVVHQYSMATIRTGNPFIIIVKPGSSIQNYHALESAIKDVSEISTLLVISHDLRKTTFPDSAIISTMSFMGMWAITSGAANWNEVKVKKKLFGGISYLFHGSVENPDVSWLMGAIAAEYERDRRNNGLKVKITSWM